MQKPDFYTILFDFSDFVRPVCICNYESFEELIGRKGIVAGYGAFQSGS